ncbi:MAG: carbamoyl-phosphate synthase large subunit [bacterium]|nr:carbamoyl-phosphate synthase large subunit [bacterium]
MPKRTDIKKVMLIGSGPIVISQACEFDYSGTQACKALKEEGYEVILVNSNPATIMTDPELATKVYIEPIIPEVLEKIIRRESPDALLPTMGGQVALNMAFTLAKSGVLDRYGVELIGAKLEAIEKAEDRTFFKEAMRKIGIEVPDSGVARTFSQAEELADRLGFPLVIRPSFTLGGTGGGIAYNVYEFQEIVGRGLEESLITQVLIEKSVYGWKEYELEVMRDLADNVIVICSIENFDPMGIHTGDSITVAPSQTLSDKEYQLMRDAAIRIIREIGVETGGANIQFAVNPETGELLSIEMNPRVSRSSALASKATGFPIAKIATKLAIGYTLDELPNDITRKTPASFEPVIDYVVIKIPRWAFEKFSHADPTLTTQMKSVGEAMAIGRTFKEALQKALRSLEIDRFGLEPIDKGRHTPVDILKEKLAIPNKDRIFYIREAFKAGFDLSEIYGLTKIDPWFLDQIKQLVEMEEQIRSRGSSIDRDLIWEGKRAGFSDKQLGDILKKEEDEIRALRKEKGILPTYKMVDTCSAEFEAYTPYLYSTYEIEDEAPPSSKKKVIILGSGPNRIGQGIEFDYCCCHVAFALKEEGFETIMINSNPETVSTDYDTSDRLYFEPLTKEDVLNIVEKEDPFGVIIQFGGQTPLKLAVPLERAGVKILGTSPDSIDLAEDRGRFSSLLAYLKIDQAPYGIAWQSQQAVKIARKLGYPVLVRPSYVLGGRAMEIVYDDLSLRNYMKEAVEVSPSHPVLIDKFLEGAIEVDVDAVSDGRDTIICGIMEHIEEAGIHSGDSACVIPPYSISDELEERIRECTKRLAHALHVIGLINIQYAIRNDRVYMLEANPRASRTIPFVSKATGVPWAKIAAKLMVGRRLKELGVKDNTTPEYFSVKEVVFPFIKFPGVDTILGPEMRSTGEVMGIDRDFGRALYKSYMAASIFLPLSGQVFISVNDRDKRNIIFIAKKISDLGFSILATHGTAKVLAKNELEVKEIFKVGEGRPDIVDAIKNREIDLIINTPLGRKSKFDESAIRKQAVMHGIPCITTISGAQAAVNGIEAMKKGQLTAKPLQEYYKER